MNAQLFLSAHETNRSVILLHIYSKKIIELSFYSTPLYKKTLAPLEAALPTAVLRAPWGALLLTGPARSTTIPRQAFPSSPSLGVAQ